LLLFAVVDEDPFDDEPVVATVGSRVSHAATAAIATASAVSRTSTDRIISLPGRDYGRPVGGNGC
jgi:hypothetical protein